jgi:hypothetical protein
VEETRELVQKIYEITARLQELHPKKNFTPDGILVGSLGEVLAEHHYGLTPLSVGTKGHDCSIDGMFVQIKTTQRKSIQIGGSCDHLIALQLARNGTVSEIYNGPGSRVWDLVKDKKRPMNGLYAVSFTKLQKLMEQFPDDKRVTRERP